MNKIKVFRDDKGKLTGYTYSECESGEWADINDPEVQALLNYVPAPSWHQIREERDTKLQKTDWIFLPDATPKPSKEAWLAYRQQLRDITKTFSDPAEVVWPKQPGS